MSAEINHILVCLRIGSSGRAWIGFSGRVSLDGFLWIAGLDGPLWIVRLHSPTFSVRSPADICFHDVHLLCSSNGSYIRVSINSMFKLCTPVCVDILQWQLCFARWRTMPVPLDQQVWYGSMPWWMTEADAIHELEAYKIRPIKVVVRASSDKKGSQDLHPYLILRYIPQYM